MKNTEFTETTRLMMWKAAKAFAHQALDPLFMLDGYARYMEICNRTQNAIATLAATYDVDADDEPLAMLSFISAEIQSITEEIENRAEYEKHASNIPYYCEKGRFLLWCATLWYEFDKENRHNAYKTARKYFEDE